MWNLHFTLRNIGKVISRFFFQLRLKLCIFHTLYVPGKYEMWEQRRFVLVRAKPSFLELFGLRCSPEPGMNWTPCLTNFSLYIREWKVKWPPHFFFWTSRWNILDELQSMHDNCGSKNSSKLDFRLSILYSLTVIQHILLVNFDHWK